MQRLRILLVAAATLLALSVPAVGNAHSAGHAKCENTHNSIIADGHAPGWGHKTYHGSENTIKYHYVNTITGWVHMHNSANYCG